jgi:translocation and assembly module TamB
MGMILKDIQARIQARDRSLFLTEFSATDGAKGTLSLKGDINMTPPFPVTARLSLNQAVLLRKELLTTTTSGTLEAQGDKDRLKLTGDITLDRTELTLPRRLPPDVVEIPVQEINLPEGMAQGEPQGPSEALKFLSTDVTVKIPARFFVRGHNLDAEFKGQINIKGPANQPVVRGTLSVVRGTYQFLARTFHITEGQIAFDGSTPPTPFLNVIAEVNAGEINAQVRITGPTNDFKLSLSSQPPLPQDEIMANILFGQSAAKLNPFQAYQLASALAQLSGQDLPDVMGKTRQLLGVDRLNISGGNGDDDQDSGPSVEAGKYVSDNVYVGVEQDLTDAKQDVVVEVDITPNFSVKSKAGTKSGAGLGFSWKYDY